VKIEDGAYQWKGSFSYSPDEDGYEETIPFELYITYKNGKFEGVSYDDEFRAYHNELPKVKGSIKEDQISFIVTYPVSFSIDEEDKVEIDLTKKGHEVIYSGIFFPAKNCFEGIWEIMPLEEVEDNGDITYQDYSSGEWELSLT
jgi:hypothetical protein